MTYEERKLIKKLVSKAARKRAARRALLERQDCEWIVGVETT